MENVNELHFQCTDFNSSARVTCMLSVLCDFITILSLSLNAMLIVEMLTNTAVTSAATDFRCHKLIVKVNK